MRQTLLIGILVFFVGIIYLFYYVLKTKITLVSNDPPYKQYINTTLLLERAAVLIKNAPPNVYENPYLLVEVDEPLSDDITERIPIEKGTELVFTAAKIFKNGVSGFSHSYMIGSISLDNGRSYKMEYRWGEQIYDIYGNSASYWEYPLALWQLERDTAKY